MTSAPGMTPRDPLAGEMVSVGGGIALAVQAVQLTAASTATDSNDVNATRLRRPSNLIFPRRTWTAFTVAISSRRAGRYPAQTPGMLRLPQPLPGPRKELSLAGARQEEHRQGVAIHARHTFAAR
jgi:hypothetical protein